MLCQVSTVQCGNHEEETNKGRSTFKYLDAREEILQSEEESTP